ncbi:titin-like [Bombus vosnesenskii]|uniref:Titin-like n=1 Tax=Bombus vosnesenskii TaxID=207650 RepID=A0A6J3KG71_9HYME|nr:titin-like [Bombus vosnesenskii]XP_033350945.1 titin-like [Bombus vosnesenskii]XP_033350946.1 titin-like [Bombus vosnesenskii]
MAEDCPDGDYLGAYSRFFSEFVARVNPYDQLPVSVSSYNVTEAEIVGEIINVTLQYLNQTQCPASLQAHLVHQVIRKVKAMCNKQPEDCGFKSQEQAYTSLKLMQAITSKVNEICTRYLDNSRLALLPPPPCTPLPQITAGGSKNCRRKMEDRYVVLHDLHSIFGIEDDSIANYYAVFDGHAGQDAAVYCASHLHQYLAESVYYPTDPERALRDAFLTTDRRFIEKSRTQKVCGGTTAVCTLILNKRLYVAWVGDSTAMLVKRDSVVQLVNPHRLHREDEVQRIRKAGGVVMQSMGTMRVNGILGVSRAIGDVQYKPFVTGEPEIKTVPLDGTEDFLILASDGLTDYLEPAEILTILYHEIQRNPNGFRRAYQVLVQWAKHAGSEDNITVVVVLLTPASAIAARPLYAHPYHRLQVNDILEKMNSKDKPLFLDIDDAHNAINSNILKQAMISQESRNHDDAGILAASNGKHENGDADYDYSDLGPETDVDAVDDVATMPVKNLSYEFYDDSDSAHDENQPGKDPNVLDNMDVDESMNANLNANTDVTHEPIAGNNLHDDDEDEDDDDDDDDDDNDNDNDNDDNDDNDRDHVHDNNDNDVPDEIALSKAQVLDESPKIMHEVIHEKMNNQVCELLGEGIGDEETRVKNDEQVDDAQDVVDEAGPVDYDDSPPSPQANKPLQHALIHEPDNVADSEDSEDEWNYYRIDPNKEKDSVTPVDEPQETKNVEEETDVPELAVEDIESKIQSEGIEEDIKCESPKEESPKLFNTEISTEDRMEEKPIKLEDRCAEEQDQPKDVDFQLNPDAAEFIPISPQFMGTRMNLVEDYPVSGSPFKQVPQMDDIQVPSQSEFEKEVCQRPREVEVEEKEYQNGDSVSCRTTDYTDFMPDQQKATSISGNMDDSEISSTKAEFGDESAVSFLTASEFHRTGISAIDESFSSSDREYDIAKDPMAMSFTPSDFEAAFDKSVDLNAVHNLSNTDLEDKNGIMEKEEEEEFMAESPNMEVDSKNVITTGPTAEELLDKKPAFSDKLVDVFANLSLQQENCQDTFIGHADESETNSVDFLNPRSECSQLEQEETVKYDHSPLAENYSVEFESKKEPVSIDNEQPLSPSSVDIDETKLIDEASEDTAALAGSDLQKDIYSNEADTPSSLSPVPDAMENDSMIATTESAQVQSSIQVRSSLHADAPEFIPTQYNFQSYGMESNEVVSQSSAAETIDVCQVSRTEETADSYQTYSTEAGDAFELVQQDIVSNVQFDEKEADDLVCTKSPVQGVNLLDFAEEQQDVCVKHPASLMTPSLSPQELQEKPVDDIVCSMECPIDIGQKLDATESKDVTAEDEAEETTNSVEEPMEPTMSTEATVEAVEPKAEPVEEFTLNLSDSMQEFTGLENQLQPTEDEILKSEVVKDLEEELIKKEESRNVTTEPEKLTEPAVEVECMIRERQEIEELLPEVDKSEINGEPETEIEQLKLEEPKVDQIEVKEPEIKDPKVEESEIKEPEINEAEIKGPEIMEPEIKEPEVKELEIKEPDVKELEIKEPEVKETEIKEPEVNEAEIKESEIMEPEIKEPEVKELEIKEPDVKELEIKEPEVKEPEVKETEIKEPEVKETKIMESEIKELKTTESEIKEPEITKSEIKEPEMMASEIKEPEVKKPEDVKELGEAKELEIEKTVQVAENKIVEAAATAAVTAAAVTAGAAAAQSKTKSKVSAAKPMKSSSKTPAPKSVPTSPSKTPSSTTRTPTAATKKPSTPSRPKDLDAPKKSTVSTAATASKPSVSKTATKTTTSTTTTKPTSRTNVSSVSKPKPVATTSSPKPTSTDKKPTANGDVKPLTKPTATKPSSKTPSITKTTLVKTSTTRLSSGTTTKPKPASATTTTVKSSITPKSSSTATNASNTTTAASTRPKTAPAVGNAMKARLNASKSPIIDKQVKETANKQISMGRTSTAASKTTRLSTSASTTTTVKRVSSTTKTTTAASPTKKSTTVTKVSKTSSMGKTTNIDKGKVLQNGVSEINALIDSMIDDVPKKDLSPVVTPNDNQLIMSSD